MVPTEFLSAPRNRKINNEVLATLQDAIVTAAGMYCLKWCVEREDEETLESFELKVSSCAKSLVSLGHISLSSNRVYSVHTFSLYLLLSFT
jgi:hypothetical protein